MEAQKKREREREREREERERGDRERGERKREREEKERERERGEGEREEKERERGGGREGWDNEYFQREGEIKQKLERGDTLLQTVCHLLHLEWSALAEARRLQRMEPQGMS